MITPILESPMVKIPRVGIGTYKLTGNDGINVIEAALENGYRHIDTANSYENEKEVGKAIQNSRIDRSELFITSKIWPSQYENIQKATFESLRKLQLDYVDLMLLHWPSDNNETNLEALEQLHAVKEKGYVKNIGVSNFNISQLKSALTVAQVICNQVEYHPYLSQEKMLEFLRSQQMFMTAYRPLAYGKVSTEKIIQEIAIHHSRTPAQVTLRWMIQQDVVVIPKTSSTERLRENIQLFDFQLSDAEMKSIFSISNGTRLVNPEFSPEWDDDKA